MAKDKQWYVRTNDGKYLTDVTTTIRPLDVRNGIGLGTIEREYAEFGTAEEAERARQEKGSADICYVTDVPPAALQKPGIVI